MKKLIIGVLSVAMLVPGFVLPAGAAETKGTQTISYTYSAGEGKTYTREMEKLNRGLVAIKTSGGVYLSWRLLDSEDSVFGSADANVSFNVYRGNTKIAEVTKSTNYLDTTAGTSYSVAPVTDGTEGEKCAAVTVQDNNYFDIALDKPPAVKLPKYETYNKWNYVLDANGEKIPILDDEGNQVPQTDSKGNVRTDSNGNILYSYVTDFRNENVAWYDTEYTINDCSVGDVDGDGEYEIIVKWDAGGHDNSQNGIGGNVILDAYKMNGTRLWRIDLGKNIRAGAHYTQFLVYDFDGDGKAEMTCKTAPGSTDSKGKYVTSASHVKEIKAVTDTFNAEADYRNDNGYVLEGDEYLTVFNGLTGEAVDTIYYPNQLIDASIWGDTYGGRCDRFTAAVAYMDGIKPYAVYMRGYYMGEGGERQAACAVSFDGTKLDCSHSFDTYNPTSYRYKSTSSSYTSGGAYKGVNGYVSGNEKYPGEGNHNCTVADVDGDGKDEVMTGALCYEIDDNNRLAVKWCTFLEHGDALHIGDYDPTHKGFEFFTIHEDGGTNKYNGNKVDFGMSVIDAETGELLFHEGASGDTGRGIMGSFGMGGYYQFWSSGNELQYANGGTSFTKGSKSSMGVSSNYNFRIFWDGDLYDELFDGASSRNAAGRVWAWNGSSMSTIFTTSGVSTANDTKNNPALTADLFGDWREEIMMRLNDNSGLRIYSTTTPTEYKIKTLMHDPVYRSGVAAEQTAYNQPPHVGMYLSEDSVKGGVKSVNVTTTKSTYKVGESLDRSNLTVTAVYGNGDTAEVEDYELSGYDPAATGTQTVTVVYGGVEGTLKVTVESYFTVDSNGSVTGYAGTGGTETLPMHSDGVEVTGIAAGALASSGITKLYIYNDPIDIAADALPSGVTIACYEDSAAHKYAVENNIKYELLKPVTYFTNVTYEEDEYTDVTNIANETTDVTIGGITYHPGARSGSNCAAIAKISRNGNSYIAISASRFANNGRNASLTLNNLPALTADSEYEFSMDFYIQDNTKQLSIVLLDEAGSTITSLQKDNYNMSPNEWFRLSLSCKDGVCTQTITNADGDPISSETLSYTDNKPVKTINCPVSAEINSTNYVYIDNISAVTPLNSSLTVNVTDKNGKAISGASVSLDGSSVTYTTDSNGDVVIGATGGRHTINVTHELLGAAESAVTLYTEKHTKTVAFDKALLNTVLTVSVKDANGTAVSGAQVSVDGDAAKSTGADGTAVFNLEGLEGDLHTIKASHSLFTDVNTSFTASQATQSETLSFSGTLPSDKFEIESVSGSSITVNVPSLNDVKIYAAKYSGAALTSVKELVPVVTYRNTFTSIGFEPDKVFMWEKNGEPLDVWQKASLLQSEYDVEIEVTDADSVPVEGATVRLMEKAALTGEGDDEADGTVTLEASRYSVNAVTDENGIASFADVPAGEYQIYIQHDTLGTKYHTLTLQSENKKFAYSVKYKKTLN